jgi:hypothetical protein
VDHRDRLDRIGADRALSLALGLKDWFFRPQVRLVLRHEWDPEEISDRIVTKRLETARRATSHPAVRYSHDVISEGISRDGAGRCGNDGVCAADARTFKVERQLTDGVRFSLIISDTGKHERSEMLLVYLMEAAADERAFARSRASDDFAPDAEVAMSGPRFGS